MRFFTLNMGISNSGSHWTEYYNLTNNDSFFKIQSYISYAVLHKPFQNTNGMQ